MDVPYEADLEMTKLMYNKKKFLSVKLHILQTGRSTSAFEYYIVITTHLNHTFYGYLH